jgi:hypothetical protein
MVVIFLDFFGYLLHPHLKKANIGRRHQRIEDYENRDNRRAIKALENCPLRGTGKIRVLEK